MIKLTIEIEIKNHEEIIKKHKGLLIGYFSRFFKDSKQKVETEVYKEIKKGLEDSLKTELTRNGVKADISIY